MFNKVFGKKPILKTKKNCIELRLSSKEILEFLEKSGIPVGKKSKIIRIPPTIRRSNKLSVAFIRGLADTDFSLIFKKRKIKKDYPRITADLSSLNLINDVCQILNNLNIAGPIAEKEKGKEYCTKLI